MRYVGQGKRMTATVACRVKRIDRFQNRQMVTSQISIIYIYIIYERDINDKLEEILFYKNATKSMPYVPCGRLRCQSRPSFIDDTCRGKLNLAGRYPTPLTLPSTDRGCGQQKGKNRIRPYPPFHTFVSSFQTNN